MNALSRYAPLAILVGLLFAFDTRIAMAQGFAPTAGLLPGRMSFTAGEPATFKGHGFAPGEIVTFQIAHAGDTPATGVDHTPAAVVTDPGGAFVATWQVCTDDCVGELLRIEATGHTSGRIGRAVFMDLPAAPVPGASAQAGAKGHAFAARAGAPNAAAAPTFERIHSFGSPGTGVYPYARLVQGTDGALYGAAGQGGTSGYGTLFKQNPDGTGFTVLKNFDYSTGAYPYAGLIQGTDGALYGTTYYGGSLGNGTAFKLNTDGTGFTVLENFDYSTTGGFISAGLAQGTDGALYGTASSGGTSGYGTVFKLNTDGTGFTVLQNLDYSTTGASPYGGLAQGTDGALYGTTYQGGTSGYGTVFKLNTDGSGFTVLQNLDYSTTGAYPYFGRLERGTDGALYGATYQGGAAGYGTVFKLNPDGSGFTVLRNFDFSTGAYPWASPVQGTDGALYGTAYYGGSSGYGTAFKMNPDGSDFTVLRSFDYTTGAHPFAGLMQGTDGDLYGTAYQGGTASSGTIFKLNTDGTDFTVLKNLTFGSDLTSGGGYPLAGPIQGTDGALYGTTYQGGTGGGGTVFRVNPDGTSFTVLKELDYSTTGGYSYSGGLTQGTDGALYGTTQVGGPSGYGTVFKLNTDGSGFTVIHSFDYSSGGYSLARVIQGTDGALYGTTQSGGPGGYGTAFKLNTDGTGFTVLHNFDFITGAYPYAGLTQGTDGALYGTTYYGGSNSYGTAFRLNTDGTGFTVLQDFDYSTTGGYVFAGLIQGTDGALYGAAYQGGSSGYGALFKLNTDGTGFTLIQNFDYSTTGGYPFNRLEQGADGALYGTTSTGGAAGSGTAFTLNPDGSGFTVLHDFDNLGNGGYPYGALAEGTDGNFYGTTYQGGDAGVGTVFRLVFNTCTPPTITFCPPDVSVECGSSTSSTETGTAEATGTGVTISSSDVFTAGCGSGGVITRTWTATGTCGMASCVQTISILDTTPPTIGAAGANATIQCPASPVFTAPGANDICDSSPQIVQVSDVTTPGCGGGYGRTVTWKARDCSGNESGTVSQTINVVDTTAPVVTITGPASGSVYAVGSAVSFTGSFTDACGTAHTASWTFDSGTQPGTVSEGNPGSVFASHTFTAAGVYMVSLAVTDACGNAGSTGQVGGVDAMVVIYDPSAGFVTGGGWIDSPAGAYTANPLLEGRANFGFVSRYKKGASVPTGETEFQYKIGNLNFHSTSYQWLVVAGSKAQFKGSGTINGAGSYGFMLTATDGDGSGDPDKFRMKITTGGGGLVYDNQLDAPDDDDPTSVLGGGSIVIHKGGNSASADAGAARDEAGGEISLSALPAEFALAQNHPNPFDRSTLISFSLPERSRISLVVYDLTGREVRTLADGEWTPGRHSATLSRAGSGGSTLGAGVYFLRMSARSLESGRSFSSIRKLAVVR